MWKSKWLWVGILFLGLVCAGAFIIIKYQIKSADWIVMFSSFSGAFLAFIFSFILYEIKAESVKKSSLHKAKYIIDKISKFNAQILEYIKQHREKSKYESVEPGWVKIPRYMELSSLPEVDFDSLIFLVDKHEQTLDSIILVDYEYRSILSILNRRNELYSSYLEQIEVFERNNFPTLTSQRPLLDADQLMVIIGRRLFIEIDTLTNILISLVTSLKKDSQRAIKKINKL